MKLKLLATLAICGATVLSCSEEKLPENNLTRQEVTVLESSEGSVTFRDGIFEFSDFKALNEFRKKLQADESFKISITEKYGKDLLIGDLKGGTTTELQRHIIDNAPANYSHVLNRDGAYVINNQYVKFGKEVQYFIDNERRKEIDWSNESTIDVTKVKVAKYGKISNGMKSNSSNARLDFFMGSENVGGGQFEFQQLAPAWETGDRKWVDEIDAKIVALDYVVINGNYYSRLSLEVVFKAKLEWRGSKGWKPASNFRTITPNFTYSISYGPTPASAFVVTAGTVGPNPVSSSADWEYHLADYTFTDLNGTSASSKWYLTGSGAITHRIYDDLPSNYWTRSWAW